MLMTDFGASDGWLMVVSVGLQWTHTSLKDLRQWWPDCQKGGCLQAGEKQHSLLDTPDSENLLEHPQARLRAGECARACSNVCARCTWGAWQLFLVDWPQAAGKVAKVISLKPILWFAYELAQREAPWEVTWLCHWSSGGVIFSLYTSWLHFSMCLGFFSFSLCCGIYFDWHFQMYNNGDLYSLTVKKKF